MWRLIGYKSKKAATDRLNRIFIQGEDYTFRESIQKPHEYKFGRPTKRISLTTESFKHMCLMANTKNGYLARKAYIQFEEDYGSIVGKDVVQEQLKGILLDKPMDWVKTFPRSFFKAAMAVYGYSYNENAPHQSPGII